jgi:transposase
LFVTPANEQERAWVGELAEAVQEASGESVDLAYVDQGHTGQRPAEEAQAHAISVEVVKHPESKHGFVLLPRRWVVERTNAWQNAHKKLVWCTERQGRVIDFWIAFSNTIIMGRLIREAWYRTTRDEPPLLFTEQFAALLSLYISTLLVLGDTHCNVAPRTENHGVPGSNPDPAT